MNIIKAGLHVAIVTNSHAGHGGSMFAVETYLACKLREIPAILATFDSLRRYPCIGHDLRRLPTETALQNHRTARLQICEALFEIAEEAKREHKMLIIDTEAGFIANDLWLEAFCFGGLCDAASVATLMPLLNGSEPAFADLEVHGINITRGLLRRWGFSSESKPNFIVDTPPVYHWSPAFLSPQVREIMFSTRMTTFLKDYAIAVDEPKKVPIRRTSKDDYNRHIIDAESVIWQTLLAPITEDASAQS